MNGAKFALLLSLLMLLFTDSTPGQTCAQCDDFQSCSSPAYGGKVIRYKCGVPLPNDWTYYPCCSTDCKIDVSGSCGGSACKLFSCSYYEVCMGFYVSDSFTCSACQGSC